MPTFLPRAIPKRYADPVARLIAKTGVTPDMLTGGGLALNVVAGGALAAGKFAAGSGLILAGGTLDLLDGAVARATGQSSLFGSIFDASADRYAEAANLFGLLVYYVAQGSKVEPVLLFAAMAGSIQTSYVKARVEVVGVELKDGVFTRTERVLLLAAALMLAGRPGWRWVLPATLWVLAIGTNVTAVQRLYMAWQKTKGMLGAEVPH
jgi:CDP-diacylglycerol---glycerol-3-phosphate 3-phosphatidyltransferase